jgi:hypothetical protein
MLHIIVCKKQIVWCPRGGEGTDDALGIVVAADTARLDVGFATFQKEDEQQ